MKPIIRVENVTKRYDLVAAQSSHTSLSEYVSASARSSLDKVRGLGTSNTLGKGRQENSFWALKNVSFEVVPGEVVGVIGGNGAGKSTLLKVLSRITEPTSGRIELYGRVGSLLEVGTGFHPDLSGRENVFLNGAILGMRRAEIAAKFDEIVSFAELEKFIDTPVKHYSSGMYMRLAFAVAAHLEPEILIVDEVLAVGDMAFQRKCLNKMQDVGQQGRTVLFVSHSMSAVTRLCERAVLISEGTVVEDGPAEKVVSTYLKTDAHAGAERVFSSDKLPGDDVVRLHRVRVYTEDGRTAETIDIRKPIGIEMEYEVLNPEQVLVPNYHFYNEEGTCAFIVQDLGEEWRHQVRPLGMFTTTAWLPGNFLAEGRMSVTVAMSTYYPMKVHFFERDAVSFQVADSLDGDSARGDYAGVMPGVVRPIVPWKTTYSLPNVVDVDVAKSTREVFYVERP